MKLTRSYSLSLRSLLAAATILATTSTASAYIPITITADDTGSDLLRYRVDTENGSYGKLVGLSPTDSSATRSYTGTVNDSIYFSNEFNGQLRDTYTGFATSIGTTIYQDGINVNGVLLGPVAGAAPAFVVVAVATIPNISIYTESLANYSTTYKFYNPNTYSGILNLTNATINGGPGVNAIYTDLGVSTTLNLYGDNTINGATLVDNIYVHWDESGRRNVTFNGNVFGETLTEYNATITYTNQAQTIAGGIYGVEAGSGVVLNFNGSNTVNGEIDLYNYTGTAPTPYAAQINVKGKDVVFNSGVSGFEGINFTNGADLTLGNDTIVAGLQINFNGNNATLNVEDGVQINANITTSSEQTGTINFAGSAVVGGSVGLSAALSEVNLNGSGSTVRIAGETKAVNVKLNAASTLVLSGGLDAYNPDTLTLGTLNYFNKNSEVQVGYYWDGITPSGPTYIRLNANISTDKDNNGTLKFLGNVTNVSGTVASLTHELALIAIGGTNSGNGDDNRTNSTTLVSFNTDVFAHDVYLNGNVAGLVMESGKNIKGASLSTNIVTNTSALPTEPAGAANISIMVLAGGTQIADFANIGTSVAKIGFVVSGVDGSSASTFTGNVFANNIITYTGVTNFKQGVEADDVTLETGTINFNAPSGTTPSNGNTSIANKLNFYDAGTANFYQGANVGSIDFNGHAGTVNISAGKNLTGDVRNFDLVTIVADGTVNFLGGTSTLTGNVGSNIYSIAMLHAGKDSQSDLTVTGDIFSNEVQLSHNSKLKAQGDIRGNVTNSSTVAAGTLQLIESTDQSVNGNIGSTSAALYLVEAGASTGATTYLNGMVYANTLKYTSNGTIELNGTNGGDSVGGIVGTVDFSNFDGSLNIGDNVNLTFGTSAAGFANANHATLTFLGSSTVTGNVGAAWTGTNPATSTVRDIRAGATGSIVNFGGKVYVSATTFHITGLGTVNFADDLVGPLVFEDNGIVNFAHTKGIVGITPGAGVATTDLDGQGTINFLGSTTQDGEIGVFDALTPVYGRLNTVNFHYGTTAANVTQNLNYSVYAWYTNIGNAGTNGTTPTTTTAIVGRNPGSGDNIHLGTIVTMADDTTTLFTSGAQYLTLRGAPIDDSFVDFVHTKNADGTLTLGTIAAPVAITQSRFDASLTTNNGTLGFAISAEPYSNSTVPGTYNGVVAADPTISSSIIGASYGVENNSNGSYLNMSGNETVQAAFLGSMKDNVSYTLVDVTNNISSFGTGPMPYTLLDNSFTIDTTLSRNNSDGDLVITTHRDAETYLTKSGTKLLGLRSYDMAYRLGDLAAAGTGYSAGLQVVFNKLDLDQWGYGNNEANLARQLYLLTPAGDGAAVKAGTGLTSQAVGAILDGSNSLSTRANPQKNYWVRAFGGHDNQSGSGEYAGYNVNGGGLAIGTDYAIGDSTLGLAIGYGNATASSSGLRDGDKAKVDSTIAGLFFRAPIGQYFLNAMIDGAKHRTKTERQTAVGERANGDYTGTEIGGAIQLGRKFVLSDKTSSLTPVLSVNYGRYTQEAYAETGAGDIGLNYTEQKYSQTDAMISLRYAVETILGEGMASSFSGSLGYKHLLSNAAYNNTVNFVGDTNTFDVAGYKETNKGSITASLAYNYNPSKGVTYTIDYTGEAKSGFNGHSLGFRATWEY